MVSTEEISNFMSYSNSNSAYDEFYRQEHEFSYIDIRNKIKYFTKLMKIFDAILEKFSTNPSKH